MCKLDIVSKVLPDFDTIIFNCFLLNLSSLLRFRLSKKVTFFLILNLRNEYIALIPNTEPPIPTIFKSLNLLYFFNSLKLKE